jgi:predicted nuclease of predicted toxin-antitoxin system
MANSVVLTKDSDFVRLLERYGPPPKIILLTCGNTSNANLKVILDSTLRDAIKLLNGGEELVEIR